MADLIAGLGGPNDELWPTERWRSTPIELDRPLRVGARGGHGLIRYQIEAYEPGSRLVFRFEPGQGLDGIHRFDVEPLGAGSTRLTHTLDVRLQGATRLLRRPLLGMHDRLIEDLLDDAERATSGRRVDAVPMPRWMRAMNEVESQLMPPRPGAVRSLAARTWGVAAPAALTGIAALHVAWALGWRWPGGSDAAFAERVLSSGRLPPDWATWTVAGLLTGAAGVVRAASVGSGFTPVRAGALAVAAALLARGSGGLALSLAGGLETPYERLDVKVYSPLCLALGYGTLAAAWHRPQRGLEPTG